MRLHLSPVDLAALREGRGDSNIASKTPTAADRKSPQIRSTKFQASCHPEMRFPPRSQSKWCVFGECWGWRRLLYTLLSCVPEVAGLCCWMLRLHLLLKLPVILGLISLDVAGMM